jgi:hypothetical protein
MLDSTGSRFRTYIGIDYLGAGRPDSQQKMLQIYERRSIHTCENAWPALNWRRSAIMGHF